MFSKQKVFCNACGKEFETTFGFYGGNVCSSNCYDEIKWKKILSLLDKEYRPDPQKEKE